MKKLRGLIDMKRKTYYITKKNIIINILMSIIFIYTYNHYNIENEQRVRV